MVLVASTSSGWNFYTTTLKNVDLVSRLQVIPTYAALSVGSSAMFCVALANRRKTGRIQLSYSFLLVTKTKSAGIKAKTPTSA